MPYSIYQSPSLSIARVSPPWSALIFSNSAGPHQGLSCKPCNVPRQRLLAYLSFLFSSSQALISQRPSSTSSYRVRHHSFVSPERYIVAIVTWSSKGARTALIKVLFHVPEVACILGISNPPLNGAAVPGLKCVWSRQVRIRFTNRRPISTASSSPQFDLVRHALDIATGIVEAP